MLFKEIRYVFINDNFAVLRVVKMILNKAILTNDTLVLTTEFRSNFMRVRVTIDQRYRDTLLNLFSKLFGRSEFDWLLKTFWRTMIRVTQRAIELTFYDKLLALTFDHLSFDTLTASSFTTTHQINGFPVLKIEGKFTKLTFKDRLLERRHIVYF